MDHYTYFSCSLEDRKFLLDKHITNLKQPAIQFKDNWDFRINLDVENNINPPNANSISRKKNANNLKCTCGPIGTPLSSAAKTYTYVNIRI